MNRTDSTPRREDRTATTTRRGLVSGLVGAGALAAAGSSIGALTAPELAGADAPVTDAMLLHDLLAVELLAAAVYQATIASGLLSPFPLRTARRALEQERAHAGALTPALAKLGGTMPQAPSGADAVDAQLAAHKISGRVSKLHSEHDCVSLLLDLEAVVAGAYYKAISKLQNPGLMRVASSIMANEAQHATAISEARRPGDIGQAVPGAFVIGRQ